MLPEVGDEIYRSGVFFLHVSALLKWLEVNPRPTVDVATSMWGSFPEKEDRYVHATDLTRPIVIAEIAPDYRDFYLIFLNNTGQAVAMHVLMVSTASRKPGGWEWKHCLPW